MANYNSRKFYNKKISVGGTNYNSGPYVIVVLDNGNGLDQIKDVLSNIDILENAKGDEVIILTVNVSLSDSSISSTDNIVVLNNVSISDSANGNDEIDIPPIDIDVYDSGQAIDFVSIADTFFIIDEDNMLQPLGVLVERDSRIDFFPSTKEHTEELPGKHGEFYFGHEFKSRLLELNVSTKNGYSESEKLELQRLFAKYLNPTKGARKLIFADDMNKTYLVKYAGKINFSEYATWFPFVIPFKMSKPEITGSFEHILVGSGTAKNDGNVETPLKVTIVGPVSNPSIQVKTYTLSYNGTLAEGDKVVIDTHLCTATLNDSENVLDNIIGELPYYLPVGENIVTADSKVVISWRSRWI